MSQASGKKGGAKKSTPASANACLLVLPENGEEPLVSPKVEGRTLPKLNSAYDRAGLMSQRMPVVSGRLMPQNSPVGVLRDSGCSLCVVRSNLVEEGQFTGREQQVTLIDGSIKTFPVAEIEIDSPYFQGKIEAVCMPGSLCDVVIGNVEGAREPGDPNFEWEPPQRSIEEVEGVVVALEAENLVEEESDTEEEEIEQAMAVETRAQTERSSEGLKRLKVVSSVAELDPQELAKEQREDVEISHLWDKVRTGPTDHRSKYIFVVDKGWLCRQKRDPDDPSKGIGTKTLVVPKKYRGDIMKMAHESLVSGHFGNNNTLAKIQTQFFWPGMTEDVTKFCQSCNICQRTVSKGKVTKVPLGKMPLIEVPFHRIAIDLVGPLIPSARGHRYILTVVDYATRYVEAVPLTGISTVEVAEQLVSIFSRVGFPLEMLSDLGTQLVSDLMKEVARLLSITQIYCTRYNPKNNGLVEKYNGLIKKVLIRMSKEQPRQWDRYLPALLFALREMPTSSLGFSPFELLYGRTVRGPMSLIREAWTRDTAGSEPKPEYQYVLDLKERLSSTWDLAHEQLGRMAAKYKGYYDKKAKPRSLNVGDKVMVLLPTDHKKMLLRWNGPFEVVEKRYEHDYVINMSGVHKTFHINLLKRYFTREEEPEQVLAGCFEQVEGISVTEGDDDVIDWLGDGSDPELDEMCEQYIVPTPSSIQKEFVQDVKVNTELKEGQTEQVWDLLYKYQDVFTDVPKRTTLMKCKLNLTTNEAVRSRPYAVPQSMMETIRKEVEDMVRLGVIERSDSPYGHPIVMVKKADGTNRFCIDFRRLNKVTVFDPEPIPNPQDLFAKLAGSKWYTKIDLTKGYWQLPLEEGDKPKTAFLTPQGKFQFRYMPFGLMTAGAQFTKLMRIALEGIPNVVSYIDDILLFSSSWQEHLETLEKVLRRLREANLGAKPSKCSVACSHVTFLGHEVGQDTRQACPQLLDKIAEASRPTTKTQVRAFLGLTGFYRDYIQLYADIALPLTDLTKGKASEKVKWGAEQEKAFQKLKRCLVEPPILHMPCFDKLFILKVDASEVSLGAALVQETDGREFPVAYASRKLLPRERRYATVEKECLAVVWAVKHYEFYLYGRVFEIHTDHKPLLFLIEKRTTSQRLLRWAMVLQQYRFRVLSVPGKKHHLADCLSRLDHPTSVK